MARQIDNQTFEKDPDALLDYTVNWGDNWLGTDTISTSIWTIPAGLHEVSNTFDDDEAIVWVSGGVSGQTYTMLNRITTAGGRIDDQSIYLRIIAK